MARILIIDDMPEVRRMVRSRLREHHEVVGELSDGYAAASEVEETQPDIVIIDYKMPSVGGVEATRAIKALFPHVVVVSYSSAGEYAREPMLAAGADAVFAKEDLAVMVEFVDTALRGQSKK